MSDPQTSLCPDRPDLDPPTGDQCRRCALVLELAEARALLRRHEWALLVNLMPTCIECHAPMQRGHFPDCSWSRVLGGSV